MKSQNRLLRFLKTETVICIAGAAAILSMFFTPPSADYLSYIDFRVLALLFCLMAVVAGFNKTGLFIRLSEKLLHRTGNTRSLCFILILLSFFTSMWITNDVALITFVPFAILLLTMAGKTEYLIFVVVLQTIAANLGSMLTPVGNPQNLYLYSYYNIPVQDFLLITLPVTAASLLLLSLSVLLVRKEPLRNLQNVETMAFIAPDKISSPGLTVTPSEGPLKHAAAQTTGKQPDPARLMDPTDNTTASISFRFPAAALSGSKLMLLYSTLFLICLLCVLRVLDYRLTILLVTGAILIFDREIMKKVDYSLLLTFVCFFIFVGNIGNIPAAKEFLAALLKGRELPVSILVSQMISNVPAAVLLSAFTENSKALILGTDLGGLGTLVASLASLISYKLYCRSEGAKPLRYLGIFTLYNILFLVLLLMFLLIL